MTHSNKRAILVFSIIIIVFFSFFVGDKSGYSRGYYRGQKKGYSEGQIVGRKIGVQEGIDKYKKQIENEKKQQYEEQKHQQNVTKSGKPVQYEVKVLDYQWYERLGGQTPTQNDWLVMIFSIRNLSDTVLTSMEWKVDLLDTKGRVQFPARNRDAIKAAEKIVRGSYEHAEHDPSVNPGATMVSYRLYDVPKDIEPEKLRCDMGGLIFSDVWEISIN